MKRIVLFHVHAFNIQHSIQALFKLSWLIIIVVDVASPSQEVEFWGLVPSGDLTFPLF